MSSSYFTIDDRVTMDGLGGVGTVYGYCSKGGRLFCVVHWDDNVDGPDDWIDIESLSLVRESSETKMKALMHLWGRLYGTSSHRKPSTRYKRQG